MWKLTAANLTVIFLAAPLCLAAKRETHTDALPPDILMDGGRKLVFEQTFSSEREVRGKRGFWNKLVDVVAGEPEFHSMVRPYDIAIDSHGRVIITDPGAVGIHIFDLAQHKYKFLQRDDFHTDNLRAPQCVAVDAHDNIYVTDSEAGKIFVFDAGGKFQRAIGSLRGGEGYFKRPTGIAVDSAADRIYVTDTLRDQVFIMDMKGSVLQKFGGNGADPGQFNFPTELLLFGQNLAVVDTLNFRVQVFDRAGTLQYAIGKLGDNAGAIFRPKGVSLDSEGHLYVVDGLSSLVQVFNRENQLLYYFGGVGTALGEFQLPAGLVIAHDDRIYVVDSFNRRVQVFHYFGVTGAQSKGGQ